MLKISDLITSLINKEINSIELLVEFGAIDQRRHQLRLLEIVEFWVSSNCVCYHNNRVNFRSIIFPCYKAVSPLPISDTLNTATLS